MELDDFLNIWLRLSDKCLTNKGSVVSGELGFLIFASLNGSDFITKYYFGLWLENITLRNS